MRYTGLMFPASLQQTYWKGMGELEPVEDKCETDSYAHWRC